MSGMALTRSEFAAPWGRSVTAMSLGCTVLLVGLALFQGYTLPRGLLGGWPWWLAVLLPVTILVGGALFVIRGYVLESGRLRVRRLLWSTDLPLDSLRTAWAAPEAMSGSLRLFGNGGLFSLSGLYRNSRLGSYRAFAMDPKHAVVLEFAERRVVVTPDSPAEFLRRLQLERPQVRIGEPPAANAPGR